jgi:hypothetical protein
MNRFQNYRFRNILEIATQKPGATRVAGMYAWNQLGRRVNKGEKGIRILAPMTGVRRKKDEEAAKVVRTHGRSPGSTVPEMPHGLFGHSASKLIHLPKAAPTSAFWKNG